MTASEAMQQSLSGVIRARLEGGMAAISRNPDGYQLSFVPHSGEDGWNLAGTVIRASYSDLGRAAAESGASDWEPAPENIVGAEPAHSVVPTVEGHHIRSHGHGPPKARSTFLGHPLHPQLILLPAGLLPYSFVMDVLHQATGKQSYADAAYHTMWGGVLGGLAAGAAGAVDYFSIDEDSPTKDIANLHAGLNVGMMALYGLNLFARRGNSHRPGLFATVLNGVATAGLLISAWYGAHMVYEHGLRVAGVDELSDATDIAPPGDRKIRETLEQLP
jgi:uncharacterized membrane protein